MSVNIMARIWAGGPKDTSERLVLLAIADHADDDGMAYPSMVGLAAKCGMTDRGVRGIVRRLEAGGWLRTEVGGGRGGKSVYHVLDGKTRNKKPGIANPEQETRNVTTENPERDDTKPGTTVPPNHHITIIEPSEEKIDARGAIMAAVGLSDPDFDAAVISFCAYRRKSKTKALTITAAKRLGESLRAIMDGGGSPADALGMAEERGWQTIKPDWYFRETGHGNGTHGGTANATGNAARGPAPGGGGPRASIASVAARMRVQG